MTIGKIFGIGVGAIALTFALGTASAEPLKIRMSWSVAPAHITPLIPHAPEGVYRHYGKSYVVEPTRIRGSGPALQAMAAGEVDISGLSAQALVLGIKRARLDLNVVAQLMSGGVEGYGDSSYYVRKDSGIKSIADLKGKKLAVNARGGTIDAAVRAITGRHGLKDGRDYQIVEVRFGAMLPALESGRIDLAALVLPFNFIADRNGKTERLFYNRDALGAVQTLQYVTRASWVAKNRKALVDFFEDHLRFRQWLYDPKNRDAALEIVSKVTKRPAKNYASWAFTNKDNYRAMDAKSDTKLMQSNIEDLNKLGILKETLKVADHTDNSLVTEAKARIGM